MTCPAKMTHPERAERRRAMAEDYRQCGDTGKVARKYGVTVSTVVRALDEAGIVPRCKTPALKTSTLRVISLLMNTKLSMTGIARKRKMSPQRVSAIYRQCKEVGMVFPGRD